jgi:hypothetical protein
MNKHGLEHRHGDSADHTAGCEPDTLQRVEIITGTGRRRRFSTDIKARIAPLNVMARDARSLGQRKAPIPGAKFEAWCQRRGTQALPDLPAVVATYLVDVAKTGADPSKPAKGAKVESARTGC